MKRTALLAILVLALLAISLAGCSGGGGGMSGSVPATTEAPSQSDGVANPPLASGIGTMSGVAKNEYGQPVKASNLYCTVNGTAFSVTTDNDGKFTVENVPAGQTDYGLTTEALEDGSYQFKEGKVTIQDKTTSDVGSLTLAKGTLNLAASAKCSFDVWAYGFSGNNWYGYYADCYVYKIKWAAVRAPSYSDSKYYSGSSSSATASFKEIPVGSTQTYLYQVTVTYRAKYSSGYEKYFDVKRLANIYPKDKGKWLSGSVYLRSWEVPIPAY